MRVEPFSESDRISVVFLMIPLPELHCAHCTNGTSSGRLKFVEHSRVHIDLSSSSESTRDSHGDLEICPSDYIIALEYEPIADG